MSTLLLIIGSNLFILWTLSKVLGDKVLELIPSPYGELYQQNNLTFLAVGLGLIVIAQILKANSRSNSRHNKLDQTPNHPRGSRSDPSQRSNDSFENLQHEDQLDKQNKFENNAPSNISSKVENDYRYAQITTDSPTISNKPNKIKKPKNSYSIEQQKHKIENNVYDSEAHKEIAMKVDWSPLAGGGANFKTKSLHIVHDKRLKINSSKGGKLFSFFFIAMGLGIPGIIGFMDFKENGFEWSLLFPLLIGSIFTGVGILMLFYPKPRYFDKQIGWFWAGKSRPKSENELLQSKVASPLHELMAIQIISERISGKNGSYTSWELNLIDKSANRFNVMDHGNKKSLLKDAQTISEFLAIPIWNNN